MTFYLLDDPQRCPGTYALDLYCKYHNDEHEFNEFPYSPYNVETYHEAVTEARKQGWRVHRDGTATCPKCVKRLDALRPAKIKRRTD